MVLLLLLSNHYIQTISRGHCRVKAKTRQKNTEIRNCQMKSSFIPYNEIFCLFDQIGSRNSICTLYGTSEHSYIQTRTCLQYHRQKTLNSFFRSFFLSLKLYAQRRFNWIFSALISIWCWKRWVKNISLKSKQIFQSENIRIRL